MNGDGYKNIDDDQLLKTYYDDKNNKWLGILLQRYTLMLLGVCMKYLKNEEEAKDCVQQIFLKAIIEIPKYKITYFKTWIYLMAKNECLMKLRHRERWPTELKEELFSKPDELEEEKELREEEEIKLLEEDDAIANMEMALPLLKEKHLQCITLFYTEKKSYQEISDQTGYPLVKVKSYIQNGKRNIKIIMERLQKDEESTEEHISEQQ